MNINFETIPPLRIAYIRHTGPYGTGNKQTMEQLKNWAGSNRLFNYKSVILGITHDNPETTKPEECRYDACIVVSDEYKISGDDINQGRIAGGSYAVFEIGHTAEEVQRAWLDIFPELLIQGFRADLTRPVIERYKAELVNNHLCEICVPIM